MLDKNFLKILLLLIFPVIIYGCSSGGGGGVIAPQAPNLTGKASKGPFKTGAVVEVYKINADGTLEDTPSWQGEISSDTGEFSIDIGDYSGALEIQVKGKYLNEVTGEDQDTQNLVLKAVAYINEGEPINVNVNIATTLVCEKAKNLMKLGISQQSAIDQAYAEIATLFSFITEEEFAKLGATESKDFLKYLDLTDILGENNKANAKFLLFNAAFMKMANNLNFNPINLLDMMAKNLIPTGKKDWQISEEQIKDLLGKDPTEQENSLLGDITSTLNTYILNILNTVGAQGEAYTLISNMKKIDGFSGEETDFEALSVNLPSFKKTNSLGLLKYGDSEIKVNLEEKPLTTQDINLQTKDNKVIAEVVSPYFTYGYSTAQSGQDMYIFVQPVDKNKMKLELSKEELVCEPCPESISKTGGSLVKYSKNYLQKPPPKTLSSSDGTFSVSITDMKLKKDITVAVTPYKSLKFIPNITNLEEDTGQTGIKVISGADINIVDANGVPTTAASACFCGNVTIKTTHIIGELSGSELYQKINNKEGTLHLLVFKDKKWQFVDDPHLSIVDQGGGVYAIVQNASKTLRLYPLIIVFIPKPEVTFSGTISGKITDKDGNPLKGVLVTFAKTGIFTVSGSDGSYSLTYQAFKADEPITHVLTFKKDGYLSQTKAVEVSSSSPDASIDVELSKIPQTYTVKGKVYEVVGEEEQVGIPGATVTLYLPVVLDKIDITDTQVETGLDQDATYTWEIYSNGELIDIVTETGKNIFILTSDIKSKMTEDGIYELKITVTHTMGEKIYTESQAGIIIKKGTQYEIILKPTGIYPSEITLICDGSGYYSFEGIDTSMDGLLNIKAEAAGYSPSSLMLLPSGQIQDGIQSQDIQLNKKEVEVEEGEEVVTPGLYYEDFESELTDQNWLLLNSSEKVGWQVIADPENIQVAEEIVDQILFPDRKTIDIEGVISDMGELTATVSFTKEGEAVETQTVVYLIDVDQDGDFENIKNNYDSYTTAQYDVILKEPVDKIEIGTPVLVSYPDPADKTISLLPAYSGQYVLWYGSTETGTISDQPSNTSSEPNSGEAISPVIDLTGFNYATGIMNTWYEIESVDVAGGQYDQMEIWISIWEDDKEEGEPIIVQSGAQTYTFNNKQYVKLLTLNPKKEPPGMQKAFLNYSSGGVNAVPIWITREMNLNPFAGHKIRIKFRFYTKDSLYNGFRGWALDDLYIKDQKSELEFSPVFSNQAAESIAIRD